MNIISQYGKEIVAFVIPLFSFLLNKFFKNSTKICYGKLHQFTYLIPEPLKNENGDILRQKQTLDTNSYVFKNEGRESATNVEITFNFSPMYINVWPSRHYDTKTNEDGRYVINFDYLAPKEIIQLELMSINHELPSLLSVRCKEGIAQQIWFYPQKVMNQYFIKCLMLLVFLGSVTFVYILIIILQWLLTKTG